MICPVTARPCRTNGCDPKCYKRDTLDNPEYRKAAEEYKKKQFTAKYKNKDRSPEDGRDFGYPNEYWD